MSQRRKRNVHRRPVPGVPASERPAIVPDPPPTPISPLDPATVPLKHDAALMRRDLTKLLGTLLIVVALFVALVLTNQSTLWLQRIADAIYTWLKLG